MRHFVADSDLATSGALVVEAYVEGRELRAICGTAFVPSRDPNTQLGCPKCDRIYDSLDDQ